MSNIKYKPSIDGLRAIAVLAVLLFHAGFQGFSGGYIGVDIFFVISGYLISSMLLREIEVNGEINFYSFYLRRLRRIYPLLLFTICSSALLALWLLSPQRLEPYGASLIAATLSVSNVYFFLQSGYFDVSSTLKPLLHTWSLGVEEQFYLVWPFFLLLISKYRISMSITIIGVLSYIFALVMFRIDPSAAFFLTPFRIFEFSMGALLIYFEKYSINNRYARNLLFIFGLSLIIIPIFIFDENTAFPGLATLAPCLGAILCIYLGEKNDFQWLITNKLSRFIGLISYSIYMLHWPVIVFYKINQGKETFLIDDSIIIVLLTIIFSIFTYKFIEKPFRAERQSNRIFICGITVLSTLILLVGTYMIVSNGVLERPWVSVKFTNQEIDNAKALRFRNRQIQCERKGWEKCDELDGVRINALIIGDSHAPDAQNGFQKFFPNHNFVISTLGGCPPLDNVTAVLPPAFPGLEECKKINIKRFDVNYLDKFDYIVINVLYGPNTSDYLINYLDFLSKSGIKKVIIFGGYLTMKEDLAELINNYGYDNKKLSEFIERRPEDDHVRSSAKALGYLFISKYDNFCKSNKCDLFDASGIPFTYDKHHLSYEFGSSLLIGQDELASKYLNLSPVNKNFNILNWGPQGPESTGALPNLQPDGSMGIWIKLSGNVDDKNTKVLFNGRESKITVVQGDLITAAISPNAVKDTGKSPADISLLFSDGIRLKIGTYNPL